jgi:FHA domain-containing protein/uncharacterized protein DUF4388
VILQGSLEYFPVAELLPLLVSHQHGGTLDLLNEATGKRTRLFLRAGRIDWAEGGDGRSSEEAILDLFEWASGSFVLADEVVLPDGVKPLDLDPALLIEEGIRQSAELRSLMKAYRPDQIFRVADNPARQEEISLSPDEFKLLFRLGQGRTIAAVCNDSGRSPAEIYPIIHRLLKNGLIQEVDQIVAAEETFRITPMLQEALRPPPPVTEEKLLKQKTLAGSLTADGGDGKTHPLLDDELPIGRDSANAIVLSDASVSSRHARVLRTPDGFVIEDLQSRNGTFVNGERVIGQRLLADNDVVRFGRVLLTFNVAAETRAGDVTNPEFTK